MNLSPRPYTGDTDLKKIKTLLTEGRLSGLPGYIHIGDIDWWIYYDPHNEGHSEVIWLWEDEAGTLLGWLWINVARYNYSMAVHPSVRGGQVEAAMIDWADTRLSPAAEAAQKPVTAEFISTNDKSCIALLEQRGYTIEQATMVGFEQYLDSTLPEPSLPDGFTFLDAMEEAYAEKRADVHFNSFNPSRMTADYYRSFMLAPGYDPTLDVVIIAPDGRFAAFAMAWIDPVTKIGNFEPVGTRNEFQRRGLGRAALYEGMRRMRDRGMKTAIVGTGATNAGNIAFYESAGFSQVERRSNFLKPPSS